MTKILKNSVIGSPLEGYPLRQNIISWRALSNGTLRSKIDPEFKKLLKFKLKLFF